MQAFNLTTKFSISSFLVLVFSAVAIGWWLGQEIERGVIQRSAATTALYINSFLEPKLQELSSQTFLKTECRIALDTLIKQSLLGEEIVRVKIWGRKGLLVYHSSNPELIGQTFPVSSGLKAGWKAGQVSAEISDLSELENQKESKPRKHLLEIYAPVRLRGSGKILAMAEFYSVTDALEREISGAQWRSYGIVGIMTFAVYLLLLGFVKRGSDIIGKQAIALQSNINNLNQAILENANLSERVRRAATKTAELNEQMLHQISAELHDGPAQHLSFALLKIDAARQRTQSTCEIERSKLEQDLERIENSLQNAVQEIRSIAHDLRLPELEHLTLSETLQRAVREHENRSETPVELEIHQTPPPVALPIKIAFYRVALEALSNATRHAAGQGQRLQLETHAQTVRLTITDTGNGFNPEHKANRLGLHGMRERIESLGGEFNLESIAGRGTTITATLPLELGIAHD